MDYDVIVVGAGPAGSTVAHEVARRGFKVLLAEEHARIGVPSHCTGKLSASATKELGVETPRILAELQGAIFYSPSGIQLTVERAKTQAFILDRESFDIQLASRAIDSGATLSIASRVTRVKIGGREVSVSLYKHGCNLTKTCKVVVGADGVASFVARQTGLYSKASTEMRLAAQKELTEVHSIHSGFAEVFLGKQYAPGFFGWIVPIPPNGARVGLCVKPGTNEAPMSRLNQFMVSHLVAAPLLKGSIVKSESIHTIPTGGPLKSTVSDGVLIVGDAAGQVKSTTGGGLYYGILCAQIAGQLLTKVLGEAEGIVRVEELEGYERLWRERLGEEISFGCRARAFLDSLSDNELDYLFQVLQDDKSLVALIEALADIDYQSRIGKSLMAKIAVILARKPRILAKACRYLLVP